MSHAEIVNYSFVPRWVGVIWKRDGAGWGEYRVVWTEKEDILSGTRENTRAHTRSDRRERESEIYAGYAGERTRRCIPVSSDR